MRLLNKRVSSSLREVEGISTLIAGFELINALYGVLVEGRSRRARWGVTSVARANNNQVKRKDTGGDTTENKNNEDDYVEAVKK